MFPSHHLRSPIGGWLPRDAGEHDGQGTEEEEQGRSDHLDESEPLYARSKTSLDAIAIEEDDDQDDDDENDSNDTPEQLRRTFASIRTRSRQYSFDHEDDTSSIGVAAAVADDGEEEEEEEEEEANNANQDDEKEQQQPASWSSLPRKSQLTILTLARLAEPISQTSLQAYMFYQLKSFNPSLPDATISKQTGVIQGAFTAAQFTTAVLWGRLADSERFGRKRVLLVGLFGTSIACVGFGFSRSFAEAVVYRILGGALNSNVGVMRTMIAEIIQERRHQSRAFLLLPMCFNIGVIVGPILGGILADPVKSYPGVFGPGSTLGGKDGVGWMREWPYALPNLLSGVFIFCAATAVFLGLDETHEFAKYRVDWGRNIGRALMRSLGFSRRTDQYHPINASDHAEARSIDPEGSTYSNSAPTSPLKSRPRRRKRLPFRQIWTSNVVLTQVSLFLLAFHISAFNALAFTFLPNPRKPDSWTDFFHFGGGLGMPSSRVGLATAIIGIVGLPLQIFVYPRVQFRLGTLPCYRAFLPFSPLAYLLMPFLVLVPDRAYFVWPALALVICLQVLSRTFSLPATQILVNNSVPDPSVLGTVHGVAQSVSSAARTLGPMLGGWGLGMGLENNIVGAVWWGMAVEAIIGWTLTWTIHEGKGILKNTKDDASGRRTERRGERSLT